MENNNNTDYNAKLQAILQSANPETYKGKMPSGSTGASTGSVYIARQLLENDIFWRIIGIYPTEILAKTELKKRQNWDENANGPSYDSNHLIEVKTGVTDPAMITTIIKCMKRMINCNDENFSEDLNDCIEC